MFPFCQYQYNFRCQHEHYFYYNLKLEDAMNMHTALLDVHPGQMVTICNYGKWTVNGLRSYKCLSSLSSTQSASALHSPFTHIFIH